MAAGTSGGFRPPPRRILWHRVYRLSLDSPRYVFSMGASQQRRPSAWDIRQGVHREVHSDAHWGVPFGESSHNARCSVRAFDPFRGFVPRGMGRRPCSDPFDGSPAKGMTSLLLFIPFGISRAKGILPRLSLVPFGDPRVKGPPMMPPLVPFGGQPAKGSPPTSPLDPFGDSPAKGMPPEPRMPSMILRSHHEEGPRFAEGLLNCFDCCGIGVCCGIRVRKAWRKLA